MFPYRSRAFNSDGPIHSFRINDPTMRVYRHFQSATFHIGNCVNEILKIDPYGQVRWREARISRRYPKEEYFLTCGLYQIAEQFRKKSWQPGAAGEDKIGGADFPTSRSLDRVETRFAIC